MLPPLSFVPAFLQIYTLSRYNELWQILLCDIRERLPIEIRSSKSKHVRLIDPLPFYKPDLLHSIDPRTFVSVISYDKYKMDIKKVKGFLGLTQDIGILDCTHIFRHIEATFKSSRGDDHKSISNQLGHSNPKTTLKYIHKLSDFRTVKPK